MVAECAACFSCLNPPPILDCIPPRWDFSILTWLRRHFPLPANRRSPLPRIPTAKTALQGSLGCVIGRRDSLRDVRSPRQVAFLSGSNSTCGRGLFEYDCALLQHTSKAGRLASTGFQNEYNLPGSRRSAKRGRLLLSNIISDTPYGECYVNPSPITSCLIEMIIAKKRVDSKNLG